MSAPAERPLGILQNNPGNLNATDQTWLGEIQSPNRFCAFSTPTDGLRALLITLHSYITRDHCVTIGDIINRWAPRVENNTQAYIDDVCEKMTFYLATTIVESYQPSADTETDMLALAKSIVHHENGEEPYDSGLWHNAWALLQDVKE